MSCAIPLIPMRSNFCKRVGTETESNALERSKKMARDLDLEPKRWTIELVNSSTASSVDLPLRKPN